MLVTDFLNILIFFSEPKLGFFLVVNLWHFQHPTSCRPTRCAALTGEWAGEGKRPNQWRHNTHRDVEWWCVRSRRPRNEVRWSFSSFFRLLPPSLLLLLLVRLLSLPSLLLLLRKDATRRPTLVCFWWSGAGLWAVTRGLPKWVAAGVVGVKVSEWRSSQSARGSRILNENWKQDTTLHGCCCFYRPLHWTK